MYSKDQPQPLVERRLEIAAIIAALVSVPITIMQEEGADLTYIAIADWIVWSVFALEFTVLMVRSNDRRMTARAQWLSIVLIIVSFPVLTMVFTWARLLRLLRVARLLRLILITKRGVLAFKVVFSRNEVIYVASVTTFLVFIGAGILTIVEPEWGGFWMSVWWAIDTTTTLGHGEVVPKTLVGRLTSVALLLSGIGLVATIAAALASYLINDEEAERDAEMDDFRERLDRIEQLLLAQQAMLTTTPLPDPDSGDTAADVEPISAN